MPPPSPFSLIFLPSPSCVLFHPLNPSADSQRSLHDGAERPCGGLYIWGCHVRFGGAAKLGDAFKSQQLPLSRAETYRVCGFAGLPAAGVGNLAQLPQGLHTARECDSPLKKKIKKKT